MSVLDALGIIPGSHCRKACAKLDHNRIQHSCRKSLDASKQRRKQIRNWKTGYSETLKGPSYGPGSF